MLLDMLENIASRAVALRTGLWSSSICSRRKGETRPPNPLFGDTDITSKEEQQPKALYEEEDG